MSFLKVHSLFVPPRFGVQGTSRPTSKLLFKLRVLRVSVVKTHFAG